MYRSRAIAAVAIISLTGCNGNDLVPVTGTVLCDGKPLSTGSISFRSQSGSVVGYATIRSDGSYSAQSGSQPGLKPGDYAVAVVSTVFSAESATPEPRPTSTIPVRYANPATSGLRYTAPAAGGTFDISLAAM